MCLLVNQHHDAVVKAPHWLTHTVCFVELHGSHVRTHCHQFAGSCFIVTSVALQEVDHSPRLADALHVFSAAAPAPVSLLTSPSVAEDLSVCHISCCRVWIMNVQTGSSTCQMAVQRWAWSSAQHLLSCFFCLCADPRKRRQDAVYRKLGHLEFTACTFFSSSSSSRVPVFTA